jgi:hypothetical protein
MIEVLTREEGLAEASPRMEAGLPETELRAPLPFPASFGLWLEELRQNAGAPYIWALNQISPHILGIFYHEGCRPSLEAVIQHCESGSSGRAPRPPQ